jgi:hypothetical protein
MASSALAMENVRRRRVSVRAGMETVGAMLVAGPRAFGGFFLEALGVCGYRARR